MTCRESESKTLNSGMWAENPVWNSQQKRALDLFTRKRNFILTGQAGTGKTALVEEMVRLATTWNRTIAVTAMTGCAAVLFHDRGIPATTFHSWMGVGLAKDSIQKMYQRIVRKGPVYKTWKKTDVLIIDEVSMMTEGLLDILHNLGMKVRQKSSAYFGGLQVILIGDFFQLPPISSWDEEKPFVFRWPDLDRAFPDKVYLTQVYRQEEKEWVEILSRVRTAETTDEDITRLLSRVVVSPHDIPAECPRLFPRVADVQSYNERCFGRLDPSPFHVYRNEFAVASDVFLHYCKDRGIPSEDRDAIRQDLLKNLKMRFGDEDHKLELRVGSRVMLLVNLDVDMQLVNGTMGTVTGFATPEENMNVVKPGNDNPFSAYANTSSSTVKYPQIVWDGKDDRPMLFPPIVEDADEKSGVTCNTMPLSLAWALSIHKVQGSSLDSACIDLGHKVFEFGQAYVALSRVRRLDGVFLTSFSPTRIRSDPSVSEWYSKIFDQSCSPISLLPPPPPSSLLRPTSSVSSSSLLLSTSPPPPSSLLRPTSSSSSLLRPVQT